jgi:hypothetical protein
LLICRLKKMSTKKLLWGWLQGCQTEYFETKNPNLGKFWRVGIFYGKLVYFTAIWYILWLFSIFSPVVVCCTKKNLATLADCRSRSTCRTQCEQIWVDKFEQNKPSKILVAHADRWLRASLIRIIVFVPNAHVYHRNIKTRSLKVKTNGEKVSKVWAHRFIS